MSSSVGLEMSSLNISNINMSRISYDDTRYLHLRQPSSREDYTRAFYEAVRECGRGADALEAVAAFADACAGPPDAEADCWRLVYCLGLERLRPRPPDGETAPGDPSQAKAIAGLFAEDPGVRRMQLAVDWLENCAARLDAAIPAAGRAGGGAHWENTLHHLETGASLFDEAGEGGAYVTALDPDAPARQGRALHALDERDDGDLCERIFKELRCGRFEEAVSLCVDAGQMWRAAVLHGGAPLDFSEDGAAAGNPARRLWKECCAKALAAPGENAHFRAALGILCGDSAAAFPVCSDSWEDLLWASLKTEIELRVDRFLAERPPPSAGYGWDAGHGDGFRTVEIENGRDRARETSLAGILEAVGARIGPEADGLFRRVCRLLLSDETEALLRFASSEARSCDFEAARFLAHLVLVLRRTLPEVSGGRGDDVVECYVSKLIRRTEGRPAPADSVAFYASRLPVPSRTRVYSDYLKTVADEADGREAVRAGEEVGIDAFAAVSKTVGDAIAAARERIRSGGSPGPAVGEAIDSLRWYSFFPSGVCDAVAASNSLMRMLIFRGDVDSAAAVLSRLTEFCPSGMIARTLDADSPALREHLCLKAYVEAVDGYASWYRRHVSGRPRSPDPLPPDCSFADRVQREQAEEQVRLERERWTAGGLHRAGHAKELLYNVLLFPRGFLVDEISGARDSPLSPEEEDRLEELASLRKLCIPEIVSLLLKVLQSGDVESHVEAIRLADVLSSESRQIYRVFSKLKLREVLHKIGESSLFVLENNYDPLGFKS